MSTSISSVPAWRRLPIGAELAPDGGVHFRVWAPRRDRVDVVAHESGHAIRCSPLAAEGNGYFSGTDRDAAAGTTYRFRLDGGDAFPDPASRFQPDGPHGPSQIVDPGAFRWSDAAWPGPRRQGAVLYEMHVGTFTRAGTWQAAAEQLTHLADLGVTIIEIMPIADFPGRFGWGYDGVNLFAPSRLYGTPDELRGFADRAHALNIGVILDVVYNHFGPDGNYLPQYSEWYVASRHVTDWGEAVNFYDEYSDPVREFVLSNAGYWIDEFHLDGLRLDATQNIYDRSSPHIVAEVAGRVRQAAGPRSTFVVAENESQQTCYLRPADRGGYGLDALWNDDWHHSAMVALTGRNEAYYRDYQGCAAEFVAAAKHGFLFQGQWYPWQKKRRGTPGLDIEPERLVHFLQNHDQIANSIRGERAAALASPAKLRALTALLLLGPQTPMLFQGQEFAASTPFLYFADHGPELMALVRKGRAEFLAQFASLADPAVAASLDDPGDPRTFDRCKLDHHERERHSAMYDLHRDLLALRRDDPCFSRPRRGNLDAAVLGEYTFLLRFFGTDDDDRLLIVNLGGPFCPDVIPEPMIAPPAGHVWRVLWASEDPRYGGRRLPHLKATMDGWSVPGDSAIVLAPEPSDARRELERCG